jgi:hypothetical protein
MADDANSFDLLDGGALGGTFLVAVVGAWSLAAAYLGIHSLPVVVVGSVVLLALCALLCRGRMGGLRLRWFGAGAWMVLPALLAVLLLSFPGFRYATGDKDPGIYVMHGYSIAHTGELRIPATELQMSGVFTVQDVPGTLWRGFEPRAADSSTIVPSFYHLWSALLADAFDAVGFRALTVVLPLLGVLAALLMFALTRRLAPPWVAGAASLVLATNMMQVWQTRYPTTEVLAQVLFLGAALALVTALQTRVRPLAFASGLLVTAGFLNRGEGVLLVMLALLGAAVAIALGLRRTLAIWFAAGLVVLLPFAWIQAYHVAEIYSTGNNVPSAKVLGLCMAVSVVVAVVGSRVAVLRRWWDALCHALAAPKVARVVRVVISAGVVVGFVLSGLRPLFGDDYFDRNGEIIRSYDERSLHRLALFFGWPVLGLAVVGLLWAIWTRWSAARTIVVTVCLGFLALFLLHARNSPQMMWWGRRFIPIAVPAIVIFAAFSLCAALAMRKWRTPALVGVALVLLATVAFQTRQSWALRGHDEKGGSYGVALSVAAVAGDQKGVFLWQNGPCCGAPVLLFGSPTWIYGGADSARLPREATDWATFLPPVVAAAGDRPVYLVLNGEGQVPADLPYLVTQVARITGALPVWEESNVARPSKAITYPYDLVIYKVEP